MVLGNLLKLFMKTCKTHIIGTIGDAARSRMFVLCRVLCENIGGLFSLFAFSFVRSAVLKQGFFVNATLNLRDFPS